MIMQNTGKSFKLVKFIHKMHQYGAGETAGFPEEVADRLVSQGIAEIVKHDRIKIEKPKDKEENSVEEDAKVTKQMVAEKEDKKKYVTK